MTWSSVKFTIMGTTAEVLLEGEDAESMVDVAQLRLFELEAKWSRFVDTSEISALNRSQGAPVVVSADTIALVESAIAGWQRTGGDFDPTVLGALIRSGYDRPFDEISTMDDIRGRPIDLDLGCGSIVIDRSSSTVMLPDRVGFDAGGIGKGLAADFVVEEAFAQGARSACVNLGGDIRVRGSDPSGGRWVIEIPLEGLAAPSRVVSLGDAGIASSSPSVRHWIEGDRARHHLIDPRRGESAASDLASVTVITASAWLAEVMTKAIFVRGRHGGMALADSCGLGALVVTAAGEVCTSASWDRHAVGA